MAEQFANLAESSLASGITSGATSLTVQTGHGARFPTTGPFRIVLVAADDTQEIVLVGARSGDTLSSLTRAAEDAARFPAAAFITGDRVVQVVTEGALDAAFLRRDTDDTIAENVQLSMAEGATLRDQFGYRFNQRETYRMAMGWNNGGEPGTVPRSKGFIASDFEYVDLTAINSNWKGFQLGIHAGKWIIYLPYGGATVSSGTPMGNFCFYDITKPFGAAASYTDVDLRVLLSQPRGEGFLGGCVDPSPDNPYVYFCSNNSDSTGTSTANWVFFRWNYTMAPDDVAAWEYFDITSASGTGAPPTAGNAYATCCHDGRYIYFCPIGNPDTLVTHGQLLRHDTKGATGGAFSSSFSNGANWAVKDLTGINAGLRGMQSIGFDGQYIYLAPFKNASGDTGLFCRYNTNADFFTNGSYETFDLEAALSPSAMLATTTNPARAVAFTGVCVVGPFVVLVPWGGGAVTSTQRSLAVRYDNRLPFNQASSYQTFDLRTVANDTNANEAIGYEGAAFDGSYVQFAPSYNADRASATYKVPPYVRWDVREPFEEAGSWDWINTPIWNGTLRIPPVTVGIAFDGRYMYHVPYGNQTVMRGEAVRIDVGAPEYAGLIDPQPDLYLGPTARGERFLPEDDFASGGTATAGIGLLGWNIVNSAGTATVAHLPSEADHPGIIRFTTGTSNNAWNALAARPSGSFGMFHVNGASARPFDLYWVIRINNPGVEPDYRVGLFDNTVSNPPANGIYFQRLAAGSTWTLNCRQASADNITDTGVTVADNTWYVLRVKWDGIYLKYSVNRSALFAFGAPRLSSTVYLVPAPPTMPTAALTPVVGMVQKSTATQNMDVDYFKLVHSGYNRA